MQSRRRERMVRELMRGAMYKNENVHVHLYVHMKWVGGQFHNLVAAEHNVVAVQMLKSRGRGQPERSEEQEWTCRHQQAVDLCVCVCVCVCVK